MTEPVGRATPAAEPPEYLVAHIAERLAADGRVAELGIKVSVHGERVFLDGVVHCAEDRDAIIAVARDVAGDYEICADLAVSEPADGAPEERLT